MRRDRQLDGDGEHQLLPAQGAAAGGYGQGYDGGSGGGDPSGMFSINDYYGSGGGGNPYEALAAGLLGHGSDKQ